MAARLVQQPHAPTDVENTQDYLINWNAGPLGVVLRPDLGADMPPVVAQLLPQPSLLKMAGVREGDILISVNGKKTTRLGYEKVVRLLFKERLPMVLHFRSPLPGSVRGAVSEETAFSRVRANTSNPVNSHPTSTRQRGRSDVEQKRHPNTVTFESDKVVHKTKKSLSKSRQKDKIETKAEAEQRRLRKQYSVVWERGSLGISFRAYNSKVNVPCVDFISATRGQGRGMDRVCVNDVLIAINGEKTKALGVEKVLRWLHVVEKPVVLRFHASSNRVQNSAGLLPHLLEDEETSTRPRISKTQPEVEPVPRPPRRNNMMEHSVPPQRMERRCSDDREVEQQLWTEPRHHSTVRFDRKPIKEFDSPNQLDPSSAGIKERRPSNNVITDYARGRLHSNDDSKGPNARADSKNVEAQQFTMKIDAGINQLNRLQQYEEATRSRQPQQVQVLSSRIRTNSASRGDVLRQQYAVQESKSVQQPVHAVAERPRVASYDSQISNSSYLSFDEAANVVARTAGRPVNECEFGGVPLLDIKEGTVQSKLMLIYAKACLAKEERNMDNESAANNFQSHNTPGNPLGRKTHSKYLSYTILQDDAVASSRVSSQKNDINSTKMAEQEEINVNDSAKTDKSKDARALDQQLDRSIVKMQTDISVEPPPAATPLQRSVSTPSSSNITPSGLSFPAPVAPTDDFISLKDFMIKDGNLTKRDSTTMPMQSTDCDESHKTEEQKENTQIADKTIEDCGETSSETMTEDLTSLNIKEAACGDSNERADLIAYDQQSETTKTEGVMKEENTGEKTPEVENSNEGKDANAHKVEVTRDDNEYGSMNSSNERDLAASVATFDDLLDLPLQDGKQHDEELEEFADDDDGEQGERKEENEKAVTDEKQSMPTSPLKLVQEEQIDETNKLLEADESHKNEKQQEIEDEVEAETSALSNPLVNELFHNVPDVRKVIKDKSALVVLVKKSMIDEIQEILQSLQMELQFERHSTTAIGSTASLLSSSQHGQDTEGQQCYRCRATGELAELNIAGGQHELYCQECWEMFFFSEERQSPVRRTSKTLDPSEVGRLTADEDALDEALKYSFHDSMVSREDVIHPWRYMRGSDSMSSSVRDSIASSITDRADEVWL